MIGPIVDSGSIIIGSLSGAFLGERIPVNLREHLPMVFGCASLTIGVDLITKVQNVPACVLALILGTIIGEVLHWEKNIETLAGKGRGVIEKHIPLPKSGINQDEFCKGMITMFVLVSTGGMGLFGAMQEGMTGDPSLLITKSFLDCLVCAIFAVKLGYPMVMVVIPQIVIQGLLFYGAGFILPLTNEVMRADFSGLGGMIMLATGLRILKLVNFPLTNMLPSLLLIMPVSYLWVQFF